MSDPRILSQEQLADIRQNMQVYVYGNPKSTVLTLLADIEARNEAAIKTYAALTAAEQMEQFWEEKCAALELQLDIARRNGQQVCKLVREAEGLE